MRLYAEDSQPPVPSASEGGFAAVVPLGPAGPERRVPVAHRWAGNLLELTPAITERSGGGRLIVNSGSLNNDLDALDPHNWMPGGIKSLLTRLESLGPALRATRTTLLLEPRSRHILHDAPVARDFFGQHPDESIGLALNPTALFEPSMLRYREDHLHRIAEALAPIAAVLILANAQLDEEGERFVSCDLGSGLFDVQSLFDACLPLLNPQTPIVLRQPSRGPIAGAAIDAIGRKAALHTPA